MKPIAILILLVILVLGCYYGWILVTQYLIATLFWAYVSIAILNVFLSLIVSFRFFFLSESQESSDRMFVLMQFASLKKRPLGRLRAFASLSLYQVTTALSWPYGILHAFHAAVKDQNRPMQGTITRQATREVLHPKEFKQSLSILIMLAIVVIWGSRLNEPTEYRFHAIMLLILVPLTKMMGDIIMGNYLPERFRRHEGNPYLAYLKLLVLYAAILLLALSAYRYWSTPVFNRSYIESLTLSAQELINIRRILNVFTENKGIEVFYTFCMATFYLAVLKSLFQWDRFNRTEEDYVSLAYSNLILHEYSEAEECLKNCKNITYLSLMLSAVISIGRNKIDDALEKINIAVPLNNDPLGTDRYFQTLSIIFHFLLPAQCALKIIDKWLEDEPNSSQLAVSIFLLTKLEGIQNRHYERLLAHPKLDEMTMPRVILLCNLDRMDEANEILATIEPKDNNEKVFQQLLILPTTSIEGMSLEEVQDLVDRWLDNNLVTVRELYGECNPHVLIGAYGCLRMIRDLLSNIVPERIEELIYVETEVYKRIMKELGDFLIAPLDELMPKKPNVG